MHSLFVRSAIAFSMLVAVEGCSGGADDSGVDSNEGALEEATSSPCSWTAVGTGVSYCAVSDAPNVLIVYGGYSASMTASRGWGTALVAARLGTAARVGKIYAVQGPADSGYGGREIQNSAISRRLTEMHADAFRVVIVAHSSGGFVANELFGQLASRSPDVFAKIAYFDLDGATPDAGLRFQSLVFVSAQDHHTATDSANHSIMVDAARDRGAPHEIIDASDSGCADGAKWCVHDAMITSQPHNPSHYDLEQDYTDFSGNRRIIVKYFDRMR
jgi:hypothetical protein